MGNSGKIFVIVSFLIVLFSHVRSDALNHEYEKGDPVPFYANKIGPFHNPSETYPYYSLPFCSPDYLEQKKESLGEMLNGDRLFMAPYKLNFLEERELDILCSKNLTEEQVSWFRAAIAQDYYSQMYYDDLPIWSFIGRLDFEEKSKCFIYTHHDFDIYYNGNHVIEVSVRTRPSQVTELMMGDPVNVEFTYSVKWRKTGSAFENRLEKYTQSANLPGHLAVHHASIANSFVTDLILIGCLVVLYVCVLRRDFYNYANDKELAGNQEEIGWKILHGDVFRYPKHVSIFAAAIGLGTQLLAVVLFILILGLIGAFHPYGRGVMKTVLVFTYAITCGLAGFSAVSFYRQLDGREWVKNLFLTGFLFSGPLFLAFCFLNIVATVYGTTAALPLGTILVIFLIWILLAVPFLSLGGISGKMINFEFKAPCRTTEFPREIPALRWYRGTLPQMALAGLLPFSAIYVELYYIFAATWGHRVYTLYGVGFVVFILLLITTALVSVGLTYFQLAAEDHQWWWRSFLCGGSTGLYVYGYCLWYYFQRSDMQGFFQTSFFFGYMACICYGIFLMLGTVGFHASLLFVRYIYSNIKCD